MSENGAIWIKIKQNYLNTRNSILLCWGWQTDLVILFWFGSKVKKKKERKL